MRKPKEALISYTPAQKNKKEQTTALPISVVCLLYLPRFFCIVPYSSACVFAQ